MNGRIRKRGKQSWEITVDLGRDPNGKRLRWFETVRGKRADADRRRREILSTVDKGLPLDNSKATVGEHLETWYRDYVVPNTAPRTAASYESIMRTRLLPNLGHIPLTRLQPSDIQAIERTMLSEGRSPTTILHVHRVLSEALVHAIRWGLLWRNPCDAVDPPKQVARTIPTPDLDKVREVLRLAQRTPHHAALFFSAYTGCRRAEVVGLRWKDVDWERKTVSIVQTFQRVKGQGLIAQPPKSKKGRRSIALDESTTAVLKSHRAKQIEGRLRLDGGYEDHDLVFPGPYGRPMDGSALTKAWSRLRASVALTGMRLHDLRHLHASLLLREGTHPRVVQERLGHSSVGLTLDTYSHVLPGLQERAAQVFAEAMSGTERAS